MNLKPLEDRIVVRASEPEETTVSGLVIPDTAKEKPQQGEVLAVGPGRRSENTGELIPVDVSVGDTIVYSKYGGTEIAVDGEDLLILTSRDVLAKVGKEPHRPSARPRRRVAPGSLRAQVSSAPSSVTASSLAHR
jgi:chaperonin GroES